MSAEASLTTRDVGVALGTRQSLEDVVHLAQVVDELGYRSIWMTETWSLNALTTLGYIAAVTKRVELGTGIVNTFSRSPAVLAQAAVSLSHLSGGRPINLGLGASGRAVIEKFHGIPFHRPVTRMAEVLQMVRRGVDGASLDFDGRVFQTSGFGIDGAPGPGPVRLFGAGLTPASVEATARHADGWLPVWVSEQHFPKLRRRLDAVALEHGRPRPLVASYVYTALSEDRADCLDRVRATLAWYIASNGTAYANLFRTYGLGKMVDEVLELWQSGSREKARQAIPDDVIDDVALAGRPPDVANKLAAIRQRGVDHPVIELPARLMTVEEIEWALRALSAELGT